MSVEPFERAKKIRRGEMDNEMPSYEELTGWIQRCPITWLPALLGQVVAMCLHHSVFQDGKLVPHVENIIGHWNSPGHGVFRDLIPAKEPDDGT